MNRFTRRIKENLLPFIVFLIIASACTGAWFFLHPSSPYHARYTFVVSYQAVGTLSPGNRVLVRGIPCGEITKVELTEDAVYVTTRVLATTKIPKNSEFRLINSGLMGEREMSVLTGDSPELVSEGDTLPGNFDVGMTGVSQKLTYIMNSVFEVRDTMRSFVDSLSYGAAGKHVDRVSNKAHRLVKLTKVNVRQWKADVDSLIGRCDESLVRAKAVLESVSGRTGAKIKDVNLFLDRTQKLLTKVQELKAQMVEISGKLEKDDNTAGLLFESESKLNKELDAMLSDVDSLLQNMKKNGIDINVDIF